MATGNSLQEQLNVHHNHAQKRAADILKSVLLRIMIFALLLATGYLMSTSFTGTDKTEKSVVTVQQGDTLWTLAQRYGDHDEYILKRVEEIARINGLDDGEPLQEGQTLIIPTTNRGEDLKIGNRYASREIAD